MANYNEESAKFIINFLLGKGFSPIVISGILGNWLVESFLRSDNAQNSYMNKFGATDESYTKAVDDGTWKRPDTGAGFTSDSIGYGLAQWTSSGRKAGLYDLCKSIGVSISNMAAQCEYAYREITRSKSLVEKLRQASSPEEAAVIIMTDYERPASKDDPTKQQIRASYAKDFYNKYFAEEPKVKKGRKFKICIDPGHATLTQNHSPVVSAYYESAFTWKYSNYKKEELERLGCEVILTRTSVNSNPSLDARGLDSNNCDAFFSEHSNAVSDEKLDHASVIIPRPEGDADIKACEELANEIGKNIETVMGLSCKTKVYSKDAAYDRNGDKVTGNDEYYGVMNGAQKTNCPIYMIIEHSCHTNKRAATWLLDDNNIKALAVSEARVIYNFLKKYYGEAEETVTASYVEYKVKSGDKLGKIAETHKTTVKAIQAINPDITDPNKIKVDQVIKIPVDQVKAQRIAEIKAQIATLEAELRELGVGV